MKGNLLPSESLTTNHSTLIAIRTIIHLSLLSKYRDLSTNVSPPSPLTNSPSTDLNQSMKALLSKAIIIYLCNIQTICMIPPNLHPLLRKSSSEILSGVIPPPLSYSCLPRSVVRAVIGGGGGGGCIFIYSYSARMISFEIN